MIRGLTVAFLLSVSAFAALSLATSITTALFVWAILSACGLAVLVDEVAR